MKYEEAVSLLESSGFKLRKLSGSHSYYNKGSHTIMLTSNNSDVDKAIEVRIKKLCAGFMSSRDVQREVHQGKMTSPPNLIGKDAVVTSTDVYGREKRGVVLKSDYNTGTVLVRWENDEREVWTYIKLLKLRTPIANAAITQEGEEKLQDYPATETNLSLPKTTLLEKFKELELACGDEYLELLSLKDRYDIYQRTIKLAIELGITVEALPFEVIEPRNTATVEYDDFPESPPLIEDEVEPEQTVLYRSEDAARIMHFIRSRGTVTRTEIGQNIGIRNYPPVLDYLVGNGDLLEVEVSNDGRKGRRPPRVYRVNPKT